MLEKRLEFTEATMIAEWNDAGRRCRACWTPLLRYNDGEYDHIIPTSIRRDNSLANCKVYCGPCHARKTKHDRKKIAKTKRILKKMIRVKPKKAIPSRPMPGTKASGIKKKMDGTVERRET